MPAKPRIAILTPASDYPSHFWAGEAESYTGLLGKAIAFRNWNDAGELTCFDLVMPLLAWGYHTRAAAWYHMIDEWETKGVRLANSAAMIRWNTDKDYLLDLADRGVAIVPTTETHCLSEADLHAARERFETSDLIVKPSISAGAHRTYRLSPTDRIPFDALETEMLIQPVMPAILDEGELSVFVFGGLASHAIIKRPATGDFRVQEQFGGQEFAIDPPRAALDLADACLAALDEVPLYARIDMVRDVGSGFRLMEFELIEPALFLRLSPDGGEAFADAVKRWLSH